MIKYRKEIDGLRAIAVLPVVFFHAGFALFSGGFVGVDVFFVISGYLITSLILLEKQKEKFSLTRFYERRARRILPALFFMSLVCVPFSIFLMSPEQYIDFSESLISIPLFISNFLFWSESGYFATAAEEKPLLHTWSLAVEEQYYLLFPLFILIFWKFGKKILVSLISLIAFFSLIISQFGANLDTNPPFIDESLRYNAIPGFAFFLAPTRIWELLAGSLTAFYLIKNKKFNFYIKEFLSLLGLSLIFASIILYDFSTPFPGFSALVPVIGTILIIIFAQEGTFINKILSFRFIVSLGLISYSVYLWHQPLFVFARLSSINAPSFSTFLLLSFISIILGWLSWKYIESPFRRNNKFKTKNIFLLSLIFSLIIIFVGIIGITKKGFLNGYSDEELSAIQPVKFKNSDCVWSNPSEEFSGIEFCYLGDLESKKKSIAIYGDSHADSLTSVLNEKLKVKGLKGIKIINNNCEPLVYFYRKENLNKDLRDLCESSHIKTMQLLKDENISFVALLYRWSFRLFPVKSEIESLNFDNKEGGIEYIKKYREYYASKNNKFDISAEAKKEAINKFVSGFTQQKIKVKLLYPIPEVGWNLSKLNTVELKLKNKIRDSISTSYDVFKKRQSFAYKALDSIESNKFLERVYPELIFCNSIIQGRCIVQKSKIPLYYDSDHLSNEGAKFLIDKVFLIN